MKIVQLNPLFLLTNEIRIISGISLLFIFLLTACAGNDNGGTLGESGTGNNSVPDACTLLSEADIEPVLGSSVSSISEVDEEGLFSTCTWIDETSGARLNLNIWGAGNAGDGWATQFLNAQAGAAYNFTVENLGAEAYANIDEDHSNYIWRVDDAFVVIFTSTADASSDNTILELARKIDNGF